MNASAGKSMNMLLVSNGFGEAAIAAYIAQATVALAPQARIEHLPLVAGAPSEAWPPAIGPQATMPSGGLVAYWNLRNLAADVRAGLISLTLRQIRFLRNQQSRDIIVAVGDVYCLSLSLMARRPTIFVATAKSDYVAAHSPIELAIARRARTVFARDETTAASMRAAGVNARYAGNVMMDGLAPQGVDLTVQPDALHVAVLPGSRSDAPQAAADMVIRLREIAARLQERGRNVQAFVSVASSVDVQATAAAIRAAGVELARPGGDSGILATGSRANLSITLIRGAFGDLLDASDIVLGQAGTANEQAAGLGRPVVAAAQPGEAPNKMAWYRMRQKRLLEDALLVLPADPPTFASEVIALLDDPQRLHHMTDVGRKRMGSAGGAAAVAREALVVCEAAR